MLTQQSFFNQRVKIVKRSKRLPFFLDLIGIEKSVLHIGCADWPIFNSHDNLHIQLCSKNSNVDGYDPQVETIDNMKTHPNLQSRNLFSSLPTKTYDIILAPETIEHVNNVEEFLLSFQSVSRPDTLILISAPNALCHDHYSRNINNQNEFIEIVHPDHNCWYSPYTLPNTIRKVFSSKNMNVDFLEIGLVENETMVYVLFNLNKINVA